VPPLADQTAFHTPPSSRAAARCRAGRRSPRPDRARAASDQCAPPSIECAIRMS
jgi:hypothetical protein